MFDGEPVPNVIGVGADTVLAVLRARGLNPADTQRKLAARVGVSDRTVRAVLAAVASRDPARIRTGLSTPSGTGQPADAR